MSIKKSREEFLNECIFKFGNKFDYSKFEYFGRHKESTVICPIHGEFKTTPKKHLSGFGCPKCGIEYRSLNNRLSTSEFIIKAIQRHGNKYDYSKVKYQASNDLVDIICPIHGIFKQKPKNHLQGKGCPICNESHLEREIRNFLIENNIDFEYQKRFNWLGKQSLDFYLSKYNIAIECQGRQHFEAVEAFGGQKEFEKILERDKRKKLLCEKHNIKIIYFKKINKVMTIDTLHILEEKVLKLQKEKDIINSQLKDITSTLDILNAEIEEANYQLAMKSISQQDNSNILPTNGYFKNNRFSCKIEPDIEDYQIVEFAQEYNNELVIKIKDFYDFQKNISLVEILENIKRNGTFFNISLDNIGNQGQLIYNIRYQDCKIQSYRFLKTYIGEKSEMESIYEVKIKYNRVSTIDYVRQNNETANKEE